MADGDARKFRGEDIVNDVLGDKPKRGNRQDTPTEPLAWNVIRSHTLPFVRPPEREWIAQDWVPMKVTTSLYADGGVGKTLLALQLQCSTASLIPWCGLATVQCRSLGLYCEDDADELHRRTLDICDAAGRVPSDLDGMMTISGYGQDNALAEPDEVGRMRKTSAFFALKNLIKEERPSLVVLDTAADLFAGDENNRQQVRQFIGFLNGLAYEHNCAIFLNAHPSKAGLAKDGRLDSGSTAWNNSVRSRLTLDRPAEDGADPVERVLRRPKANYARSGAGVEVRLRWERGVIQPIASASGCAAIARSLDAEAAFLTMLDAIGREGRHVSDSSRSHTYAPKQFAGRPDRQGFNQRDFEAAMQRLFVAGKIKMEEYGKAGGRGKAEHIVATVP